MISLIFFSLISLASTGSIYYFLGLYKDWWWFWVIPVGIIVFYLLAFGSTLAILYLIALFFKKEEPDKPDEVAHFITCQMTYQTNFLAGVRVKKSGLKQIDKNTNYMIIYNHTSNFDPMVIMAHLRRVYCITKPENKKIPIVGSYINKAGFISIDRSNDAEGMKSIIKAIDYLDKEYGSICIAPEGTRSKTLELLPFHAGCFNIAKRAEVPILAIGLKNTFKIRKNFPKKITRVKMDVLSVIKPEEFKDLSTLEISNNVHKLYEDYLGGE